MGLRVFPQIEKCSSFGVMQGRLSLQTDIGYQAFPGDSWELEFFRASEIGFQHIEWIIDSHSLFKNPFITNLEAISEVLEKTEVRIKSLCLDYLMDFPLSADSKENWSYLEKILESMSIIGADQVVIPFVDQSSMNESNQLNNFLRISDRLGALLGKYETTAALETDLCPESFSSLLSKLSSEFTVNYDIGNSAALGYRFAEEFQAYGDRISLVHIKDRLRGGESVFLGNGSAEIIESIRALELIGGDKIFTMQAFRDNEGLCVLLDQLNWLTKELEDN